MSRPAVLLLAGDVKEEWSRELEAGGFEVRTTGWLDAVTAARLERPNAVVVSTDLPQNAPQILCTGFRSSTDLNAIPIVVAGLGAERLEQWAEPQVAADRYLGEPVDPSALTGRVHEAVRLGRQRVFDPAVQRAVMALLLVPSLALLVSLLGIGAGGRWLVVLFVAPLVAVVAVSLAARKRPLVIAERRRLLLSGGLFVYFAGQVVAQLGWGAWARWAGISLALCAFAGWGWLGRRRARAYGATRG